MKILSNYASQIFTCLLSISFLFPIIGCVPELSGNFPPIMGVIDVSIAFLCFSFYLYLYKTHSNKSRDFPARKMVNLMSEIMNIPLLLLLMYFLGAKLEWEVLLIGLGWRFWLLLQCLAYLVNSPLSTEYGIREGRK